MARDVGGTDGEEEGGRGWRNGGDKGSRSGVRVCLNEEIRGGLRWIAVADG